MAQRVSEGSMDSRRELLQRLRSAVTGPHFIHAAWLEGADARGLADDFSDVDLWLDVEPGHETDALLLVRDVVETFGPLTVQDEPAHPHPQVRQCFLGSAGLSPFQFVDVCVQSHGREVKFTAVDPYLLWFDRSDVIRHAGNQQVDVLLQLDRLVARKWRAILVEKELRRGHPLEALHYYHNEVLTLLVRFLRLKYGPEKLEYGLKHVHGDLPPGVVERLLVLHALHTQDTLSNGVQEAQKWMTEIEKEIRGEP